MFFSSTEDKIEHLKTFLENNPIGVEEFNNMSVDEKQQYFAGSGFDDWAWKDDEYSKELKALYHRYYGIYLGVDKDYLKKIDISKINEPSILEIESEEVKAQIKLQQEAELEFQAIRKIRNGK